MDNFLEPLMYFWSILSTPFIELSGNQISIISLVLGVGLLYASFIFGRSTEHLVTASLEKKDIDPGIKTSTARFSRYFVIILGLWISLDSLGIDLSSLAAVGAVLMVGIGFGLQNITQNFISGLILLLERPIKKGDMVEVRGVRGKVLDIQARSTLVLTWDDVVIVVPNSQFISEQVVNDSFSGEKIRQKIKIGVAYGSNVELVRNTLANLAYAHPKVLKQPKPRVFFADFGESSLDFELIFWVAELWDRESIKSDIRYTIDTAFRKEGIQIPFPQRVVHTFNSDKKEVEQTENRVEI
ncbi:MAG: mechanosensitive ion channel family protein [Bdellovibrionales bacterium]